MSVEIRLSGKRAISRQHPVPVASDLHVITATLTLDTAAYAAGDTLADVVEIPIPASWNRLAVLQSIAVLDEDDQGAAFDLIFFSRRVATSAKNAAWNTTDAEMRAFLDFARITTGDYVDLGSNRIAKASNLSLILPLATDAVYVYTVAQGAPTYTANGLRVKFGFLR